jgi:hypothetical protein
MMSYPYGTGQNPSDELTTNEYESLRALRKHSLKLLIPTEHMEKFKKLELLANRERGGCEWVLTDKGDRLLDAKLE